MKTSSKIIIGILILAALGAGTYASIRLRNRGQETVQTARVTRETLVAIVTSSGEIRPRTYTNLAANAQGRIVELLVNEGDRVRRGQVVARIESVQAKADVEAQRANISSVEADTTAAEAGVKVQDDTIKTQEATVDKAKAAMENAQLVFDRTAELWEEELVSKLEYDQRKTDLTSAAAGVREAEFRLDQLKSQRAQTEAQVSASQRRVAQAEFSLQRMQDILEKHDVISPLDGIVTNLPVRVGETVVPGIQNSAGSAVMTIADMSLITAEVAVDETDIVYLALGQHAEVSIDAIPDKTFPGHIIEIGNTAILRSTGEAASNSTTSATEAKDFKVVIALDSPPDSVRPGLSCTADITTDTHENVLGVPIQALTVRQQGDIEAAERGEKDAKQDARGPIDLAEQERLRKELTGAFVLNDQNEAVFHPVETGITGETDIEILSGLDEGDEIIIGPYQVIRTLRPMTKVQVDNSQGAIFEEQE